MSQHCDACGANQRSEPCADWCVRERAAAERDWATESRMAAIEEKLDALLAHFGIDIEADEDDT